MKTNEIRDFSAKLGVKIACFILLIIMVWVCAMSSMSCMLLADHNAFSNNSEAFIDEILDSLLERDAYSIWLRLNHKDNWNAIPAQRSSLEQELEHRFSPDVSNLSYAVYDEQSGTCLLGDPELTASTARYCRLWSIAVESAVQSTRIDLPDPQATMDYLRSVREDSETLIVSMNWEQEENGSIALTLQTCPKFECTICLDLKPGVPIRDQYGATTRFCRFLSRNRYLVLATAVISFSLVLVLLNLLILGAGRRPKHNESFLRPWDSVPLELYLAGTVLILLLPNLLTAWVQDLRWIYLTDRIYRLAFDSLMTVYRSVLLLCILMTLVKRGKARVLLKKTLIHRSQRFFIRTLCRTPWGIKLYLRILVYYFIVSLAELCVLLLMAQKTILLLWGVEKVAICAFAALVVYNFSILERGGEALKEGNVISRVRTDRLLPIFRRHGETLNSISKGMKKTLEERTRSEHMKAELIANVSHDLKTPLTSIVNYVDLLKKAGLTSPEAPEYLNVLDRQAVRLKKLVLDLVEASKAASGSLPIEAEELDMNLLVSQAAGEYTERMRAHGLEQVIELAPGTINVWVDPKLLWRVFDNLLGNAMLYSQRDSRIYISTELEDNKVVVIFRNISCQRLNISADELMERFVRGDSSRNSEGSGLGLSIAKSLTELQGGVFRLVIDGDLFKAILRFPIWEEEP